MLQSGCMICLVFVLVAVCSQDPVPDMTDYSDLYQFDRYNITYARNFNDSRATCERNGGHLAYMDREGSRKVIEKLIYFDGPMQEYWLGATDWAEEGTWVWLDGRSVDDGVWDGPDEPNNNESGEDCALIRSSSNKLNDKSCALSMRFICQKELRTNFTFDDRVYMIHRLETERKNYIDARSSCEENYARLVEIYTKEVNDAIKEHIPIINYTDTSYTPSKYWIGGRYNTTIGIWLWNDLRPFTFLDWVTSEPIADNLYGCVAIHKQGWNSNICFFYHPYICEQISVQPEITSITAYSCNASLLIEWSNAKAPKIQHRVSVSDGTKEVYSKLTDKFVDTATGLSSTTLFTVVVTPCPGGNCREHESATAQKQTGGIPDKIRNVTVEKIDGNKCDVNWTAPASTPEEFISGYKIIGEYAAVDEPPVIRLGEYFGQSSVDSSDGKNTSHTFIILSGRKYRFGVQARTCAGLGTIQWSEQYCTADESRPIKEAGISTIVIVLIAIVAVMGCGIIVAVVVCFVRKYRKRPPDDAQKKKEETELPPRPPEYNVGEEPYRPYEDIQDTTEYVEHDTNTNNGHYETYLQASPSEA